MSADEACWPIGKRHEFGSTSSPLRPCAGVTLYGSATSSRSGVATIKTENSGYIGGCLAADSNLRALAIMTWLVNRTGCSAWAKTVPTALMALKSC